MNMSLQAIELNEDGIHAAFEAGDMRLLVEKDRRDDTEYVILLPMQVRPDDVGSLRNALFALAILAEKLSSGVSLRDALFDSGINSAILDQV